MPDKCQTNRKKGNMARFVFVVQSFSYLHVKFNQTCSSFKYINWVYNFQSRDQKFNIVHLILTFKEKKSAASCKSWQTHPSFKMDLYVVQAIVAALHNVYCRVLGTFA